MEIVRLHLATIGAMRDAWSNSLHKLHEIHPHQVHFCHDTKVVHG
jgi:hypothetical protein